MTGTRALVDFSLESIKDTKMMSCVALSITVCTAINAKANDSGFRQFHYVVNFLCVYASILSYEQGYSENASKHQSHKENSA